MVHARRMVSDSVRMLHGYEKILEEYFHNTNFQFQLEKQAASIDKLKKWLPLVYLRNRPLVCIDVEAWERNIHHVTEIGIAVYDPALLQNSILPIIKPYHIIVKEHIGKYNGRYVADNKKHFLGGKSHVLRLDHSKQVLQAVIQKYISEQQGILVGHDIQSDIKWLNSIGVKIHDSTPIVDTLKLYNLSKVSGGSLRGILRVLNIPHGYLHNAANDAYFTLLAAMGLCDPTVRRANGLDTFSSEVSPVLSQEKRLRKFTDIASYEHVHKVEELIQEI